MSTEWTTDLDGGGRCVCRACRRKRETAALEWYVKEWDRTPMMPDVGMWIGVMENLHRRARERFGDEAGKAAGTQFRTNKGWTTDTNE